MARPAVLAPVVTTALASPNFQHTGAPPWPVLDAPAHWQVVDFISDLHLQASEPATAQAWSDYMARTQADAIFILGDLFEVWVGDDAVLPSSFEQSCLETLRSTAQRCPVYFMHGNRDFLLGPGFAQASAITLLHDPTVLNFADQRWLLSHGDGLCLDDHDYLAFRTQVRSSAWQQAFLAKPLAERRAIALALRQQSEARKQAAAVYADVDSSAATACLHAAHSQHLIHGHTHRPAEHALGGGLHRSVLSDWDPKATPPRSQVLRLRLDHYPAQSKISPQRIAADLA